MPQVSGCCRDAHARRGTRTHLPLTQRQAVETSSRIATRAAPPTAWGLRTCRCRLMGSMGSTRQARPTSESISVSEKQPSLSWRATFMTRQESAPRWMMDSRSTMPASSKIRRRNPGEAICVGAHPLDRHVADLRRGTVGIEHRIEPQVPLAIGRKQLARVRVRRRNTAVTCLRGQWLRTGRCVVPRRSATARNRARSRRTSGSQRRRAGFS